MWRTGLSALLSHWRRNPMQAATLLVGLALATALWTGVQAINAEARASYDQAAAVLQQNAQPVIVARNGGDIALSDYVALRRAGWQVSPVIETTTRLGGRSVTLLGLDPLSAPVMPAGSEGDGDGEDGPGLADLLTAPGQLFAAPDTIARLSLGADMPALLPSPDLAPGVLVGDVGIVAGLVGQPEVLTRLVLLDDQPEGLPPLSRIAPDLVESRPVQEADIGGLTGSFHLNLTAFGMLSFAVGLFIVHGAVGLAFEQRRPLVRTLRTLGLPLRALSVLLLAELFLVALVAGLIGVALGYVIASALLPDVAATLRGLYGAPASGSLALRWDWVLSGLFIALAGTAIASVQALTRTIRMPVLAPAQPRAWSLSSERELTLQAALAVLLMAVVLGLILWASGLAAGFTTLAAFLVGAALALPPVLAWIIRAMARRQSGPVGQWFWADARQQLPGLSLALMALLLALSANIGVSTMVGSFRTTFLGWLDQRLAAEIYLDAGPQAAPELSAWLEENTLAVLPQAQTDADLGGVPGSVRMMPDHDTYRDHWPLLDAQPGAWDALADGDGVLINEQWALQSDLSAGGAVEIDGTVWPILAIYSDYGNPRRDAAMGQALFTDLYPEALGARYALRVVPEATEPIRDAIKARFGLRDDQITNRDDIREVSLEIFERTFAVTGALNVLTLGVAGVAILTSLLTVARMRLPQVAPLWALGLTRQRLARLELGRAAALAGATSLLAIPTGLAVAWLLLAIVNVEAFGWRLPMRLFPLDWLVLAGLGVLAAVLAALIPARRLATRPPADLLRVFASER